MCPSAATSKLLFFSNIEIVDATKFDDRRHHVFLFAVENERNAHEEKSTLVVGDVQKRLQY